MFPILDTAAAPTKVRFQKSTTKSKYLVLDSTSRSKSPTGSYEDDDEVEPTRPRSPSVPKVLPPHPIVIPQTIKEITVPVIKVDDQVVFTGKRKRDRSSNENKTRLGPNKNNIILETLQKELSGAK